MFNLVSTSFVSSANLLRVHSAPSSRSLMKILNRTGPLGYTATYWPPTRLCSTDHYPLGLNVEPVFNPSFSNHWHILLLSPLDLRTLCCLRFSPMNVFTHSDQVTSQSSVLMVRDCSSKSVAVMCGFFKALNHRLWLFSIPVSFFFLTLITRTVCSSIILTNTFEEIHLSTHTQFFSIESPHLAMSAFKAYVE